MPIVALLAFIRTPVVSDLVLEFSLKLVRFRTGINLDAESWDVNPFSFSGSLQKITTKIDTITITAPEVTIQLSPIYLFVGKIHFNKIKLDQLHTQGSIPKSWLEDSNNEKQEDFVSTLGVAIANGLKQLGKHNLGFEQLVAIQMKSDLTDLTFSEANIQLWNLEEGQIRLQIDATDLESKKHFSHLAQLKLYLSLLKSSQKRFLLSFRDLQIQLNDKNSVSAEGAIPGRIDLNTSVDIKEINNWIKSSPAISKNFIKEQFEGNVQSRLSLTILKDTVSQISGEATVNNIVYDGYRLKSLFAKFQHENQKTVITDIKAVAPNIIPQESSYAHLITSPQLTIKDSQLTGSVSIKDLGLCAVLYATTVEECFTSLKISGKATVEGPLSTLRLKVKTDLKQENGFVASDNLFIDSKASIITRLKPATLQGELEIRDKDLSLLQIQAKFGERTQVLTNGTIVYIPTLVDLVSESENFYLEDATHDFLDLPIEGHGRINVKSFFSKTIDPNLGRTRITTRVSLEKVGVSDQVFGDVTGNLLYAGKILEIGPLKVRNGGGRAGVVGQLKPTPHGGHLNISAALDKLELQTYLNKKTSAFISGFVSGSLSLQGLLKTNQLKPSLSGPMNFNLEGIKIFNIPLEQGTVQAHYKDEVLYIQKAEAVKNRGRVSIEGKLDPKGGSYVNYKTQELPISTLGYLPDLERVFTDGNIAISGFWKPSVGVEVNASLKKMRVAERPLGNGEFSFFTNDDLFKLEVKSSDLIDFEYLTHTDTRLSEKNLLNVKLKNTGIYSALAYLNGWKTNRPFLKTDGDIELNWKPNSGTLKSNGLSIQSLDITNGKQEQLLNVQSNSVLSWQGQNLSKNTFRISGVDIESDGSSLQFQGKLKTSLIDIFIPDIIQVGSGQLIGKGTVNLPPSRSSLRLQSDIQDGIILLDSIGRPINSVTGKLDILAEKIVFRSLQGNMGSGTATLQGEYAIGDQLGALVLDMQFKEVEAVLLNDVPITTTGYLNMRGEGAPYLLSGRVNVSKALYAKEYENQQTFVLGNSNIKPSILYSIEAEIGGESYIKNSLISSQVSGSLFLKGSDLSPQFTGSLEFHKGIIFAKDNEFNVSQGRMVFSPQTEAVPVVNLRAESKIKLNTQEYRVELSANGPTNNLNLSFNSEPSLTTNEILSLLAFGVLPETSDFNSSDPNNSTNFVQAAQYEAFQAVFGKAIGKNLNKQTGLDVRVTSAPDLNDRSSIPKVTVGTRISKDVTATYGRSLDNTRPTEDVRIDYKLLDNVNLSGVWQNTDENESSTGLDLRFRFDIK